MVNVPLDATDDALLQVVRSWLDVLAAQDYEGAFAAIGYAMAYGKGAEAIRRDIQRYRSPQYYPGDSALHVSDWRTASGGNPDPLTKIERYHYSQGFPLVAAISVDLPLNGRWSDLTAHFVVAKPTADAAEGVLWLEDIRSPSAELEVDDA